MIELRSWMLGADASAVRQARFVQEDLLPIVGAGLDYEDYCDSAKVISEHVSKSVRLPVYEMRREDLGLRLVMRNNFADWKLSVTSERHIGGGDGLLSSLFHTVPSVEPEYTGNELAKCYFEGFRAEDVFGYYCQNPWRWSASIANDYRMWATIFHIMRHVGPIGPMTWGTRAGFAAEVEARRARREARAS